MSWIGRRTDGSGTSSGVRSVVSSGRRRRTGGGARGGVVVVLVVVEGSAGAARVVGCVGRRRPRQRAVGEVRVGGRSGGDDEQRDERGDRRTPPIPIGRSAPRRACESVLELVESMVSLGPVGPECAVSRRRAAIRHRRTPPSRLLARRPVCGKAEQEILSGLLRILTLRCDDSRGARESGRLVDPRARRGGRPRPARPARASPGARGCAAPGAASRRPRRDRGRGARARCRAPRPCARVRRGSGRRRPRRRTSRPATSSAAAAMRASSRSGSGGRRRTIRSASLDPCAVSGLGSYLGASRRQVHHVVEAECGERIPRAAARVGHAGERRRVRADPPQVAGHRQRADEARTRARREQPG